MTDQREAKRIVRIFTASSFLNDLGSDMIYPIWPLFVTSVLGANMAILGLIDGLGEAIVSISQALSGYLSDRTKKRKIFIWSGYLFGSVSRVGYAFSSVWQQLIPFRIIDRFGKIRGAPRDAMIADVSTKENRGKNFGLLRAMDNFGAVTGITISILLFGTLGYRNLFLLASIPSLIGVLLILYFIKEKKQLGTSLFKGLSMKQLDNNFRLFLVLSALFALGTFSYSFLMIFAKEFGFEISSVPVLYLIFTAVTAVSSLPFGKLSDKLGRKHVLMLSFIFWAAVCLTFLLFQNAFAIVVAFVFYGLHLGSLHPVQRTFVSELAPIEYRASTLGGFQMVVGLCALPASLIAGILWENIGLSVPFYFSLALTSLAIILLIFVREQ